jgi:hypothetical protein
MLSSEKARPTIDVLGSGLKRPECVLAHRSGALFVPTWEGSGGVAVVHPNGRVTKILSSLSPETPLRANGIALEPGGSFLAAHLGERNGGIYRLLSTGSIEPVLTEIAGRPLPPSNFTTLGKDGRVWLSVSTTISPRSDDYRPDAKSGFIAVLDRAGPRIVADGLAYANEFALSDDERFIYVNETFGKRTTRFAIRSNGELYDRTTVAEFGDGIFPDGIALDQENGLWITSPVSNCVLHVDKVGQQRVIIEDGVGDHVVRAEQRYHNSSFDRSFFESSPSQTLRNISSLAFGGAQMRTAYLGSLLGESIPFFETAIGGLRPSHFDYDLGPLQEIVRSQ